MTRGLLKTEMYIHYGSVNLCDSEFLNFLCVFLLCSCSNTPRICSNTSSFNDICNSSLSVLPSHDFKFGLLLFSGTSGWPTSPSNFLNSRARCRRFLMRLRFAFYSSLFSTQLIRAGGAAVGLLPSAEHVQHGHWSPTGDHGGHHPVPFLHRGSLNLDSPQLQ